MTRALHFTFTFLLFCCCTCGTVRIACGGPGGTDTQGNVWAADSSFSGGFGWTAAAAPAIASFAPPYNVLRYGAAFSYGFQLPPGQYTVMLKFIEPRPVQTAGARVFSVAINGTPVLTALDLFAVAGSLKAWDRSFPVSSAGTLTIAFSAASGNAVVSGIQIDGVPSISPGVYSGVYTGGQEYTPAEACLKGIVVPFGALLQPVAIATVPDGWNPWLVQVEEVTRFASNSPQVTVLTASLGTLEFPTYYLGPMALMRNPPNLYGGDLFGPTVIWPAHTLYLSVNVGNVNPGDLSSLTAGSLAVRICGSRILANTSLPSGILTVGTLSNGICKPFSTLEEFHGNCTLNNN